MPQAFSSVTTLQEALKVNYAMGLAGTADPGGKIATLISAVNQMSLQLSYVQAVLVCANLSAIGFSAISVGATPFSGSPASITNFT